MLKNIAKLFVAALIAAPIISGIPAEAAPFWGDTSSSGMEQQELGMENLPISQEYLMLGDAGESTNRSTFPEPVVISEEDEDEDNPFYKVLKQSQREDTGVSLDQLFQNQPHPSDTPLCPYPFIDFSGCDQ